jgi:prevent-host-death family protein
MDVGIRELKKRLSEYLDRVAAGETLRVTDRGRPKAIIRPIPDVSVVARGLEEGWLTRPSRSQPPKPVPRTRARRRVLAVLDEDRRED